MRRALAAIVLTIATPALANDLAGARKLFEEGIKREESNDWAGALEKFRAVAAIRSNHIVRFHIALCLEKTGKLVDALSEFSMAKVLAEKEGGTDAELTIANSTKHLTALRARIPAVVVKRPAANAAALTIDGAAALFDTAVPLDPGEHVIAIRAEAHRPFEKKVTLVEGEREPIAVDAHLEKVPVADAPKVTTPKPPVVDDTARDHTFAYVVGGIGFASLATAGVFYGLRSSALSELDGACDGARDNCDPTKRTLEDRGKTYTMAGNVLLGVGAVALGTAITILVLEPKRAAVVTSGASLGLRVTF